MLRALTPPSAGIVVLRANLAAAHQELSNGSCRCDDAQANNTSAVAVRSSGGG
jgi:hypothetical protein